MKLWRLEAVVTHGRGFISLENSKPTALPARWLPKEPRSGAAPPLPAEPALGWEQVQSGGGRGSEPELREGCKGRGGAGAALCGR